MADQLHLFGSGNHPSRPRAKRECDPLFDALMFVTKTNPAHLTASGRGMANRALKELRQAGATPPEILHRSRVYVERFRHTPTAGALVRHWASLSERPSQPRMAARRVEPLVSAERRSELAQRARAWISEHRA